MKDFIKRKYGTEKDELSALLCVVRVLFLDESEEKAESGAYAFAEKMIEHIQEEPCRVFKLYHPSKPVLGYINKNIFIMLSSRQAGKKMSKSHENSV